MTEKKVWRTVSCREPLLVSPRALGSEYERAAVNRPYGDEPCDGVYVIDIHGPLEHHEHPFFASFENVSRITCKALERDDVKAIVWRIDSPGGVANGMGAAAREIREYAKRLGKPIFAYADEQICSAAYGLACAASEVWCPPTAEVGSVGVILPIVDQTSANERAGIEVALIVTGERKGDGHPDKKLDDATIEALQARVDAIGEDFFALVAEAREISVDDVRALQAGVFVGERAIDVGLADGVALWSEFFELVKASVARENTIKQGVSAKLDAPREVSQNAKKKGLTMKKSNLALTRARKKAEASLATAQDITDPTARKAAIDAAVDELSSSMMRALKSYKKTIKVEEIDDSGDAEDKDEEKKDAEDKDDDEPESERMPHGEEEDAEDEAEEEEEGEEDAEDEEDDEKKDAKKSRKSASVVGRLRELTGAKSRAELLGRLDAMADKASRYEALAGDVAKLKQESRSARVEKLIKAAIDGRKVAPSNAKQIAFLRTQGMESPKRLAAYVEAMPRLVARTTEDGPIAASISADGGIKHIDELAPQARKVIEIAARTSGISIEKATAEYLTAYNRAAGR